MKTLILLATLAIILSVCETTNATSEAPPSTSPDYPCDTTQKTPEVHLPIESLLNKRVTRGPDWRWNDQDKGGQGVVTKIRTDYPGWVSVRWDSGYSNNYRWGYEDKYDLVAVIEEKSELDTLWDSMREMHNSLTIELRGGLEMKATNGNLEEFYEVLLVIEERIEIRTQRRNWFFERRDHWKDEMRYGPRSISHAAKCLIAVDDHIYASYQSQSYLTSRGDWLAKLLNLSGGLRMRF